MITKEKNTGNGQAWIKDRKINVLGSVLLPYQTTMRQQIISLHMTLNRLKGYSFLHSFSKFITTL